jgi:hypothetical protein
LDDLWTGFKVPEWGVFCHKASLRNHPARLKLVLSDTAQSSNVSFSLLALVIIIDY